MTLVGNLQKLATPSTSLPSPTMTTPEGKKRKHEKETSVAGEDGMLAAQASIQPSLDTSKWPLLLKVCLHFPIHKNIKLV